MNPTRNRLDASRWHWQHGPIDLILDADGEPAALRAAYDAAWARFSGVLSELVVELQSLRQPVQAQAAWHDNPLSGPIARRMWCACHPHRARCITPMAAVAGSVADELIAAFDRPGIERAYINNGGDIALHLTQGRLYRVGVFSDLARYTGRGTSAHDRPLDANFTLDAGQPVRGIATSGWRGRSFSLGIADSVTVLARTAAMADAAATIVANAVDVEHAAIVRRPAASLKDDSDLGDRLVTVDVPPLPPPLIDFALSRGAQTARHLREKGLIECAALFLQGQVRVVGADRDGAWSAPRANLTTEATCSTYAAC